MSLKEIGLHGGYTLLQDSELFKLTFDSVILSDFAAVKKNMRVIDLGTGCGAIPVLLAIKCQNIFIEAVEIVKEAVKIAEINMERNGYSGIFKAYTADIRKIGDTLKPGIYDLAISNPPYFDSKSGKMAAGYQKSVARSEVTLNIFDVCQAASYLLKWHGKFASVYRPERLCHLISSMKSNNLEPKRMRFVHKDCGSPPSLVLMEGLKGGSPGLNVMPPLYIKTRDGSDSDEIKMIYHKDM